MSPTVRSLLLLALLLPVANASVARRQARESGTSLGRWLTISVVFTLLELAPVFAWLAIVPLGDFEPWDQQPWPFVAAAVIAFVNAVVVMRSLRPTVAFIGTNEPLPLVEDAGFLAQVARLAAKMGIRPPRTRVLNSLSSNLSTQAWAGGYADPSLVVSDGVLHRLTPPERDAIVAHELAHLANHSLWMVLLVTPLVAMSAVAALLVFPPQRAVLFGLALWAGASRLVRRPIELDCDRRAARAMGCREMASALEKLHAANPFQNTGWLALLNHATSTHPHLQTRLAAIHDAAPETEQPAIPYARPLVRQHRIAGRTAFWLWLAVIVASLASARRDELQGPWGALLLLVAAAPLLIQQAALWRPIRRHHRLRGEWFPFAQVLLKLLVLVPIAAFCCWMISRARTDELVLHPLEYAGGVAIVIAMVIVERLQRRNVLRREVLLALQRRDFAHALELGAIHHKRAARDTHLRYNLALAAGMNGDVSRAIAEFEALRRDKPRFLLTWLTLSVFYLHDNQPEQALAIAQGAADRLKWEPAPAILIARAARRLGDLDRAEAAIAHALAHAHPEEPEAGIANALAAGIALDRGDTAKARQLIETALKQVPGEALALTIQAEIALQTLPPAAARQAVDAAVAAIDNNPFALLQVEREALKHAAAKLPLS